MSTSNGNGNGNGNVRRALNSGDLAAWTGVVLMFVFGVGGAVLSAIGIGMFYVHARVAGIETRELPQAFEFGRLTERINQHGDRLTNLDIALQREMRDVNATTEAKLAALDERLQQEIATAQVADIDRTNAQRSLMHELQAYQDSSRGVNAEQTERLDSLERQVFGDGP